ncbi:metalloproteinase inhibitor 4-like [Mizuhopecten yessoensis]|uniref:Metalloproteinase inhibitor 3 n=1 Tax=Mizuhopecten yessoensis TaxID=6573 RepID=A0A210PS70_MIZYE|nr:metalloproteinase inhibitor 4-like [Mizuhopecten yessoensis]OWF39302.1 Metalloproteinase inhibitor 3 [Mizuhopecten yessoensis]
MMEMNKILVVFVLGVFLPDLYKVHACFCPESHPQTDFCHLSSFALVGYVTDIVENNKDRRFNVGIQYTLRFPGGYTDKTHLELISHKGPTLCELSLVTGEYYMITGYVNSDNEYLVNSCMWTENFESMTSSRYNGLLGNYDCSCYINETWGLIPPKATARDICNYDKTTSCEHAACMRGEDDTCEWLLNCEEATSDFFKDLKRKTKKELDNIL